MGKVETDVPCVPWAAACIPAAAGISLPCACKPSMLFPRQPDFFWQKILRCESFPQGLDLCALLNFPTLFHFFNSRIVKNPGIAQLPISQINYKSLDVQVTARILLLFRSIGLSMHLQPIPGRHPVQGEDAGGLTQGQSERLWCVPQAQGSAGSPPVPCVEIN